MIKMSIYMLKQTPDNPKNPSLYLLDNDTVSYNPCGDAILSCSSDSGYLR